MSNLCVHCGEGLGDGWEFCARCGKQIEHLVQHPAEPVPRPEQAPVGGAFGGLYFGLLAMPLMLVVGIMLCLTGWGIFLGIPVIIAAFFAPLAGPLFGMRTARVKSL
jgi:hypothetical protein